MVPVLGFGMRPLGPRKRAKGAMVAMSLGRARRISKFILPALISVSTSGEKMTTLSCLPMEWGRVTSPLIPVSLVLRCSSMVLSLEYEICLKRMMASEREYVLFSTLSFLSL